jgi:CBS domain-containing protein
MMRANELMTSPVISILPDATVEEVIALMLDRKLSGLPVVDARKQLVGMISEGDFLRRFELGTQTRRPRWIEFLRGPGRAAEEFVRTHGRKVQEVMTDSVVSATPNAPLDAIVELMERHRIKRVPIVEDSQVVGIVTRADILRALTHTASAGSSVQEGDEQIRAAILTAFRQQSWVPHALVAIEVKDGIVDLSGTIFDEREREGIKIIAENVAGVHGVRDHLVWLEPISGTVFEPPQRAEPE